MRFILIIAALLFLPTQSFACSCALYEGSIQAVLDKYHVFIGRSVKTRPLSNTLDNSFDPTHTTFFDVMTPISSGLATHFEISHRLDGAACGVYYEEDEVSLIVAHEDPNGELETGYCHTFSLHPALLLHVAETKEDVIIPDWETCHQLRPNKTPPTDRLDDYTKCSTWWHLRDSLSSKTADQWIRSNYP